MRFWAVCCVTVLAGSLLFLVAYINKGLVIESYNQVRIHFLDGGGQGCLTELSDLEVEFTALGDQGTEACPVLNSVKFSKIGDTSFSSPVIMSCPAAVKLAYWAKSIEVKKISHIGTLNCRSRRGSRLMSEHSYGIAIDITAIEDAEVSKHWRDTGHRGKLLRRVAKEACSFFSNVLTPDTNRLHHGHFHFDDGMGFSCDIY